jgi:crotonobetaine/carnitine-CoA ligase
MVTEPSSLGELLRQRAGRTPDAVFVVSGRTRLTFADVDDQSEAIARGLLARGVVEGARVAVMLRNGVEFPLTWLAIAKIGAVAVPVSPGSRTADLRHVLRDTLPHLVVAEPDLMPLVSAAGHADVCPPSDLRNAAYDPALPELVADRNRLVNLQYTSGTTGMPKACMLTADYWLRLGQLAADVAGVRAGEVTVTAAPFHYIDPQWNVVLALVAGSTLEILPRFDARTFMADISRSGATFCYLVGTMAMMLLKQHRETPLPRHRLRLVVCSGIPAAAHGELERLFGAPWREAYGATETGLDLVMPQDEIDCVGSGALGVPVAGKDVSVRSAGRELAAGEVGELCVRGTPMMRGYWNREEPLLDASGWRRTGDLATVDERGWFRLVGRLKDMVRRGGENISATEVETVLLEHPDVVAAAVVPVADEVMGEEAKAYVQLRPGAVPDAAAVLVFVSEQLAAYKTPRYLQFVPELPRTASERIAKAEIPRLHRPEATYDARVTLAGMPGG